MMTNVVDHHALDEYSSLCRCCAGFVLPVVAAVVTVLVLCYNFFFDDHESR